MKPPNYRSSLYDPNNPDLDLRFNDCDSCTKCCFMNLRTGICQKHRYLCSEIEGDGKEFPYLESRIQNDCYFQVCDTYEFHPQVDVKEEQLESISKTPMAFTPWWIKLPMYWLAIFALLSTLLIAFIFGV